VLEQELGSIGITLKDRVLKDATTRRSGPWPRTCRSLTRPGWGKDYSDPYAFSSARTSTSGDHPTGNAKPGVWSG